MDPTARSGVGHHGDMFVRYYMELPLPARQGGGRWCSSSPAEWLSTVAGEAQRRGDHLLTEVGVGPLGPRLRSAGRDPGRPAGPLPLDDLAAPDLGAGRAGRRAPPPGRRHRARLLGEDRTQLAISARYRPPLGALGRTVDRVLLHRVAEATVKDFLDRVGAAITSQAGRRRSSRSLMTEEVGTAMRLEATTPSRLSQPGKPCDDGRHERATAAGHAGRRPRGRPRRHQAAAGRHRATWSCAPRPARPARPWPSPPRPCPT